MGEERRLVCRRRYGWLNTACARSTYNHAIMSVYVGVNRGITALVHSLTSTDCSCITIIIIKQRHLAEDVQLVESASPLD
jgi:hypothetical protein